MITNETDSRAATIESIAVLMMSAARTAPKACGLDNLEIATITGATISAVAKNMKEVGRERGHDFFLRDADNIEMAGAVVLIGTRTVVLNLNCGLCGYPTCTDKMDNTDAPCMFNSHDLGIAVGSAVSIAADNRVDTRVMYSAGLTANLMGLMGDCHTVMAIPLSVSGKNPFFDRKTTTLSICK